MTVLRLTSLALVKLGYLLETPSIPHYSFHVAKCEAVKMCWVRTISRKDQQDVFAEILRDYTPGIRDFFESRYSPSCMATCRGVQPANRCIPVPNYRYR